ncbi:MAG: GvpL/GvpF family gas vesicle protein [Chloroflexota bacterium]|nr:GvpL/GvpF family gas vesicle protein [Chloroflexota bacterium]
MKNGIYIYGIIATSNRGDDHRDNIGRGDIGRGAVYKPVGTIGIGNKATEVVTIGFRDIAAVVSSSPLMVYDSLAKEKIVKDLVTHQVVIEKVMEHATIIPVKFGAMVETEEEVVTFLEQGYPLLSNELRKMEGKIELDVVASADMPKILASISRQHREVRQKRAEIATKGAQVSVEDKISLGQLTVQALQAQKASYYELMLHTLQQEALDTCLHELPQDEMILNAAFLLEKRHEESFTQRVKSLDRRLEDTVNFRVVGPLPVYSFATILLERIDPCRLAEARETFGLQGEITHKTVLDTYRHLAQRYHPDVGSDADSATFQRIYAAYRTLKTWLDHGCMHIEVYRWEKDAR